MKNTLIIIGIVVFLLVVGGVVYYFFFSETAEKKKLVDQIYTKFAGKSTDLTEANKEKLMKKDLTWLKTCLANPVPPAGQMLSLNLD